MEEGPKEEYPFPGPPLCGLCPHFSDHHLSVSVIHILLPPLLGKCESPSSAYPSAH